MHAWIRVSDHGKHIIYVIVHLLLWDIFERLEKARLAERLHHR